MFQISISRAVWLISCQSVWCVLGVIASGLNVLWILRLNVCMLSSFQAVDLLKIVQTIIFYRWFIASSFTYFALIIIVNVIGFISLPRITLIFRRYLWSLHTPLLNWSVCSHQGFGLVVKKSFSFPLTLGSSLVHGHSRDALYVYWACRMFSGFKD